MRVTPLVTVRLVTVPLAAVVAAIALPASAAQAAAGPTARTGGGSLNVRAAPTTAQPRVGTVRNGAALAIACQVAGQQVRGYVRASNLWDRLAGGGFVAHAYVAGSVSVPTCAALDAAARPVPGFSGFLGQVAGLARAGRVEFGVPASVTVAQAVLESGWGESALSRDDHNFFGIKCFFHWGGPIATGCKAYKTFECDAKGKCWPETAEFRTYASLADSVRDHGRFLRVNDRYAGAFKFSGDGDAFAREIARAGYATNPKYADKIIALMRQYDLYRLDR